MTLVAKLRELVEPNEPTCEGDHCAEHTPPPPE
jgi:hypothetical protein